MFKHIGTHSIGGLQNVGYINNSDNLIILSQQGTGVFNCLTGERIYRDNQDWWANYNQIDNTIKSVELGTEENVQTSGLFGGINLPISNNENWELIMTEPEFIHPPFEKYLIRNISKRTDIWRSYLYIE